MLYDSIIAYQLSTPPAVAVGNDGLTFEKELIYVGDFKDRSRGVEFSVDEALLDHWCATHAKMIAAQVSVPCPKGHTEDPEQNRAELISVCRKLNEKGLPALYGTMRFRDKKAAELAKSANVSVYVPPEQYDGKGNRYVRPIKHVAFTDYPVIPGLGKFKAIAASMTPTLELGGPGSGPRKGGGSSSGGLISDYTRKEQTNAPSDPASYKETKALAKSLGFEAERGKGGSRSAVADVKAPKVEVERKLEGAGWSRVEAGIENGGVTKDWFDKGQQRVELTTDSSKYGTPGVVSLVLGKTPSSRSTGAMSMSMSSLAEKLGITVADKEEAAIEAEIAGRFVDLVKKVKELEGSDEEEEEPVPPKKIAASHVTMLRDNRSMKIDRLLGVGKITSAVAKKLKSDYCSDESLTLSLSHEDSAPNEQFESLVKLFDENEPVMSFKEKTRGQTLELAHTKLDPKDNALVADAERRAKAHA